MYSVRLVCRIKLREWIILGMIFFRIFHLTNNFISTAMVAKKILLHSWDRVT
jgi:hypothetical protein